MKFCPVSFSITLKWRGERVVWWDDRNFHFVNIFCCQIYWVSVPPQWVYHNLLRDREDTDGCHDSGECGLFLLHIAEEQGQHLHNIGKRLYWKHVWSENKHVNTTYYKPATYARMQYSTTEGREPRLVVSTGSSQPMISSILWEASINKTRI